MAVGCNKKGELCSPFLLLIKPEKTLFFRLYGYLLKIDKLIFLVVGLNAF